MLNILAKKSKVGVRPSCKTWPQEPLTSQSRCLSASRPRVSWHRRETADSPRAWSRALHGARAELKSDPTALAPLIRGNLKLVQLQYQITPSDAANASCLCFFRFGVSTFPSPGLRRPRNLAWKQEPQKYCGCLDERSAANTHVKAQSPSLLARSMHAVIIIRSIGCTRLGHDLHRI